jgi:hypothetical protein
LGEQLEGAGNDNPFAMPDRAVGQYLPVAAGIIVEPFENAVFGGQIESGA